MLTDPDSWYESAVTIGTIGLLSWLFHDDMSPGDLLAIAIAMMVFGLLCQWRKNRRSRR